MRTSIRHRTPIPLAGVLAAALALLAVAPAGAQPPPGYYDTVDASHGAVLRRRLIERAVGGDLSPEERERVSIFAPEELLGFLGSIPREEREELRAGWKVRVRVHEGERTDAAARARAIAGVLTRSVKRLRT